MRDLRRFWRNVRNFLSSFLRFITICRSLGRLKSLKLCFPQWHIDTCYRNFNRSTTRPIVMNRRNVCHWRVVERFWTMLNDFERSILHGISPLNDRERSKTTKTWQFLEILKNFGKLWVSSILDLFEVERWKPFNLNDLNELNDLNNRPVWSIVLEEPKSWSPTLAQGSEFLNQWSRCPTRWALGWLLATGLRFFFSTIARGFSRREIRAHRLS